MNGGFAALPTMLLQRQKELGITPLQINILLNLVDHWFEASVLPFPSYRTLAARIGVSARTLQRAVQDLKKLRLLERQKRFVPGKGQSSNYFSLQNLVWILRYKAVGERREPPGSSASPRR